MQLLEPCLFLQAAGEERVKVHPASLTHITTFKHQSLLLNDYFYKTYWDDGVMVNAGFKNIF